MGHLAQSVDELLEMRWAHRVERVSTSERVRAHCTTNTSIAKRCSGTASWAYYIQATTADADLPVGKLVNYEPVVRWLARKSLMAIGIIPS